MLTDRASYGNELCFLPTGILDGAPQCTMVFDRYPWIVTINASGDTKGSRSSSGACQHRDVPYLDGPIRLAEYPALRFQISHRMAMSTALLNALAKLTSSMAVGNTYILAQFQSGFTSSRDVLGKKCEYVLR